MDEYAQARAERTELERSKFKKAIAGTTSAGAGAGARGGGARAAAAGGGGPSANSANVSLLGGFARGALKGGGSAQAAAAAGASRNASYRSATSAASSYKSAVGSVASGLSGKSYASSSSSARTTNSSLDRSASHRSLRSVHSVGNLSAYLFDPENEHYLDPDLMEQRARKKERQRQREEEEQQERFVRERLERQRLRRQQRQRARGGRSAGGSDSGRNSLYSVRTRSSDGGNLSTDGSDGQRQYVLDDRGDHAADDDARSVGTISIDLDAIAQEMKSIYARPHPDDVQAQTKARVQKTLRTARDELMYAKDELIHLGEHVVDGVRRRSDGTLLSAAAAAALGHGGTAGEEEAGRHRDEGVDSNTCTSPLDRSSGHRVRVRSAVRHAREELIHLGEMAADGVRRGSDFFTGSSDDSWGEEVAGGDDEEEEEDGDDDEGGADDAAGTNNDKSKKKRARSLRSVVEAVAKQMPHAGGSNITRLNAASAAKGADTARPKKGILKRPSVGALSDAGMAEEEAAASRLAAGSGDLPLHPAAAYKYEEEIISLADEDDENDDRGRNTSRRRSIDSGAYLAGVQDFLRPTRDEPTGDERRMASRRQSGDSNVSNLTSSLGGSSNSSRGIRDVFEDEDDDEEQGHGDKMESIGLVGGSNERAKLINYFRSRRILLGVATILFLVTIIAVAVRPESDNAIGFHLRPEFFDIPMPPTNLDDICQQSEYREECEIVCNQASCCYKNGRSSCRNSAHESICALYSACDILYNLDSGEDVLYDPSSNGVATAFGVGSQKVVPKPPPFLSDICSPSGDDGDVKDHDSCLEICSEASCCLEKGPNLSCRNNPMNSGRCSLYRRYCSNLPQSELVSDFDGIIPSPPLGLGELCDKQHISADKEAAEECERLCSVGLCCVGLGLESNCALTDNADCMGYKRHCAAVWPDEAYDNDPSILSVEVVPAPFESVCSPADQESLAKVCDELCNDVASCCWDKGPGNCLEYNRATCNDYSSCDGYTAAAGGKTRDVDAILPRTNLEQLCTAPHVLHPDGVKDCKDACLDGGCCLLDESNDAYCGDRPVCSHYEVCSNLPYDEWARQDVPSPIEYICSNERLDTPGGREACSEACESGRCCWDDSESYSCFADDPSACCKCTISIFTMFVRNLIIFLMQFFFVLDKSTDEYDACRANTFVPSAPSNLPKVCADANNPASKALCLRMCQPAACCFEGKMTTGTGLCEVANLYTCSEYDGPCDNVLDMMDYGLGQRSAVTPVVQACSQKSLQTDVGIQSCRKQCSDAWCCVVDDPSLSCFESNPLFCAAYAPVCGPLLSSDVLYSDIKDKSKATANPIDLVCSIKNILSADGRAQCEAECSYAACCKESGRWSCQDKSEEYCEEMKACDVLERVDRAKSANVGVEVPHAAGNINDLCSKQAIMSFSGRSECDKACIPGLCCFDADESTSCRSTNQVACNSYEACSIMFQDRLGL